MANLTTDTITDNLVDELGNVLTDIDDLSDIPSEEVGGLFPVMLRLRLRLHAAWLLFMLMPT